MIIPLPTLRGKILIILAMGNFAVAMVNANPATALIASLFFAIIVSSLAFSFTSVSGLRIRREPSKDGVMGEPVLLPLKITNITRRPRQTVIVREDVPFSVLTKYNDFAVNSLASNEERALNRTITADKRGTYPLNKISIIGGDSMGIFRVTRTFELPAEIVIYPATTRITQIPLELKHRIRVSQNGRPLGVSGQGQDIFGIREYRPGDPVRFIHWKASAKQRKLVMKEFEAHAITKINIMLDVREQHIGEDPINNNFEYLVSTAASLVRYLSGVYCNVSFIAGENNNPGGIYKSGTAYSIGKQIMGILADIQPADTKLEFLIDANMHIFQPNSVLYFLTLPHTEDDRQLVSELIDRGIDVRWIYAPRESFPKTFPDGFTPKPKPLTNELINVSPSPKVIVYGMHIEDALTCTN